MASGWMLLARQRRMRGMTRGFALSDHADWQGLTATIAVSGAERIWTHHGYAEPLARWCREKGLAALHLPLRDGSDTP
jgi:putative mRNA 3-end processing factor